MFEQELIQLIQKYANSDDKIDKYLSEFTEGCLKAYKDEQEWRTRSNWYKGHTVETFYKVSIEKNQD